MHSNLLSRRGRWWVGTVMVSCLAACGGGGGGDDDGPPIGPTSATVTLTGVAAKGLMQHALVTAHQPDAKGAAGIKIAETLTDANGRYTLPGMPQGGLVLLTVSRNADVLRPSTMTDEAGNQDVPVPQGFQLQAAVVADAPAGTVQTVQITPYSSMAVAKAIRAVQASGQFGAQVVGDANADIRRYTGYDVLGEEPLFDASGHAPRNAAALALTTVATLATLEDEADCPALTGLSDDGARAAARLQCTVERMTQLGSNSEELAEALNDVRAETIASESYTGAVPPVLAVQPITLTTVPIEDIAAAKSLVSYLRSDVPFLVDDSGDTLRTRLLAIEQDLRAAINPLDSGHLRLIDAMVYASELFAKREHGAPTTSMRFDDAGRQIVCTFYTDTTFDVEAPDVAQRHTQACRVSYSIVLKRAAQAGSPAVYTALQHAIYMDPGLIEESAQGGRAEFALRTALLWQDGTLSPDGVFIADWAGGERIILAAGGADEAWASRLVARVTGTWNAQDYFTSISVLGDLAPSYQTVDGVTLARGQKSVADLVMTPQAVPNGISKLAVQGGFASVAADGAVSSLRLLAGSQIQGWLDLSTDDADRQLIKGDDLAMRLVLEARTATGSSVSGTLDVSRFTDTARAAASGLTPSQRIGERLNLPASIGFQGVIARNEQQLMAGTLTLSAEGLEGYDTRQPLSESPALTLKLVFDATMRVPSRPDLVFKSMKITHKQGAYTLDGALQQGSTWVSLKGSQSADKVLLLDLLSDSAVSLGIDSRDADNIFPLMRNGHEVGLLDRKAGQITFADGSYEQ